MTVALNAPELVSALIPVDNAPVNSPLRTDFGKYVRGMQHIESANVTKQSDADKILQDYEEVCLITKYLRTQLANSILVHAHSPIPAHELGPLSRGPDDEIPRPTSHAG